MRPLYGKLVAATVVYAAAVILNVGDHYMSYRKAHAASQDTVHHGPNLRQTWEYVAEFHSDRMLSPKVLIPLESILGDRPVEPLRIIRGK